LLALRAAGQISIEEIVSLPSSFERTVYRFDLWEPSPPNFSTRIPLHSDARLPFNFFDDVPFEGEAVVRGYGKPSGSDVVRTRVGSDGVFAGSPDAGREIVTLCV
jgi:hypothetical protein